MKRLLLIALLGLSAACDEKGRGMETRTYELQRLSDEEAEAFLTPYIREGGYLSARKRLVSVRESEDRLKLIEEMLKKYDGIGEASDVILQMQVIEANGFTTRDPAIADIEANLREAFRYQGYRLAGETRLQTRENSEFSQTIGGKFQVQGRVQRISKQGAEQRVPVELRLHSIPPAGELITTVTVTIGKPTVLGQSTEHGALILVIRPSVPGQ